MTRGRRHRISGIAAAVVLTVTLLGVPAAAQSAGPSADDPVATMDGFLDAFVAQDVAAYGQFMCVEKRDAFVARYDRSAFLTSLPPGVDGAALIAAMTVDIADRTVTLESADDATATVTARGRLLVRLEDTVAREFIAQMLEAQGMVVTDEIVEQALPQLLTSFGGQATSATGQPFDRTVTLILEDGIWVICDDEFGFATPDASGAPSPSTSPATPSAVPSPAG